MYSTPGISHSSFLHRLGDALLDFARRGARHLDEDVDHGDDDLRLFFAGQFQNREPTQQQ